MRIVKFIDRLSLIDGLLVRTVTALCKDKILDVYTINENQESFARNLYFNMYGYRVAFPGDSWRDCGHSRIEALEWGTCKKIDCFSSSIPNDKEKALIINKYPSLIYTLNKVKLTIAQILDLLPIFLKHPEVENLLASGYFRIAYNRSFYKLSEQKKKEVIKFLIDNRNSKRNFKLSSVMSIIKNKITIPDYDNYYSFCCQYSVNVTYQEFLYLARKKFNIKEIHLYVDYKRMLKKTIHSIKDDYWHYPKDLMKFHDKVMQEIEAAEAKEKEEKLELLQKKYKQKIKKYMNKTIQLNGGIKVFVPGSTKQIDIQAKALNQCLITSDYIDKVIQGKCVLVFVHRKGKPLATAELLPKGTIGQFYGNEKNRNKCYPSPKAKEAVAEWMNLFVKKKAS